MGKITVIPVTGGPGGGKTEAMKRLSTALGGRTRRVMHLPEPATFWHERGVDYVPMVHLTTPDRRIGVQGAWSRTWFALLQAGIDQARLMPEYDWVIFPERGPIESKVYLPEAWEFKEMLARHSWSESALETVGDAVLHFQTAAYGQGYTLENNPARTEKPMQARELDRRLMEAWSGHHKQLIIPNTARFEDKVAYALEAVTGLLEPVAVR